MSEGEERKREERFTYLMNRSYEVDFNPSLFASIAPEKQERVEAFSESAGVKPDSLLSPNYEVPGKARFLHGETVCGEIQGEAAERLKNRYGHQAYFRVVEDIGGFLTLQVCATNRKRLTNK